MPHQGDLSVKDKWSLDSQLGEMLRDMEKKPGDEFRDALTCLMQDYNMDSASTIEILLLLDLCVSDKR